MELWFSISLEGYSPTLTTALAARIHNSFNTELVATDRHDSVEVMDSIFPDMDFNWIWTIWS